MSIQDSQISLPIIEKVFRGQQQKAKALSKTSPSDRRAKLKQLEKAIFKFRDELCLGMWEDFRKPATEVDLTEIYPVLLEIRFALEHLSDWMADESVASPLSLFGAKSKIRFEAKGTSLILSPWNYPFQLLMAPLVSAIAAGCTAILKPSEYTPNTVAVIKKIIDQCFEEDEVFIVEGGVDVSTELLKLKFDHIFFTGSPEVGKVVMAAAAKNLTSVTLELGGKSPTIIDETADLNIAASRIAWAKFINAGQTCIAPDYILIHESKKAAFVEKLIHQIRHNYGNQHEHSEDLASIINLKHFDRLREMIDEAVSKGATILFGGEINQDERTIAPTVIDGVTLDSDLMQSEIFGPLLPILTYSHNEDVVNLIQSKEKPLALYVYSRSRKNIDYFLSNTSSGGVGINISAAHIGNSNLPFGGVNNSGIGKSRGKFGFLEFSNQRAILRQNFSLSIEMLAPPYTPIKKKIISFLMKYF